jgi:hypothetical protein
MSSSRCAPLRQRKVRSTSPASKTQASTRLCRHRRPSLSWHASVFSHALQSTAPWSQSSRTLSFSSPEVATSDICKVVPPNQHPSRCVKHEAAVIAPSRPQDVRCQVQWHHRRLLQPPGRRRVDPERETCIDRARSGAAPRQLARASVSPHLTVPAVPYISVEVRLLDAYMR